MSTDSKTNPERLVRNKPERLVRNKAARLPIRLGLLLILLGMIAGVAAAVFLPQRFSPVPEAETEPVITYDILEERLRGVQELVTVEYHYTNMGKFENRLDFYGWRVPFTAKSFIISYDGVIRAGVNMKGMNIKVDEWERRISIDLPGAGILSHEIPEDSIQIFDESRNIFNPITIRDYTDFTRDQKAIMEKRAIDGGLYREAEERALLTVNSYLEALPIHTYQLYVNIGGN